MNDGTLNPFAPDDAARRQIWQMLVPRDIAAFVRADWSMVADDFVADGFSALDARGAADPEKWKLAFPDLAAYRKEWLRQARAFQEIGFAEDPEAAIFRATSLTQIELMGTRALARKKFDGRITKTDGTAEVLNWQTLYLCARVGQHWKITSFVGYLPFQGTAAKEKLKGQGA